MVEVGFGNGQSLAEMAKRQPECGKSGVDHPVALPREDLFDPIFDYPDSGGGGHLVATGDVKAD